MTGAFRWVGTPAASQKVATTQHPNTQFSSEAWSNGKHVSLTCSWQMSVRCPVTTRTRVHQVLLRRTNEGGWRERRTKGAWRIRNTYIYDGKRLSRRQPLFSKNRTNINWVMTFNTFTALLTRFHDTTLKFHIITRYVTENLLMIHVASSSSPTRIAPKYKTHVTPSRQ